jgi:hypothetical protein
LPKTPDTGSGANLCLKKLKMKGGTARLKPDPLDLAPVVSMRKPELGISDHNTDRPMKLSYLPGAIVLPPKCSNLRERSRADA